MHPLDSTAWTLMVLGCETERTIVTMVRKTDNSYNLDWFIAMLLHMYGKHTKRPIHVKFVKVIAT